MIVYRSALLLALVLIAAGPLAAEVVTSKTLSHGAKPSAVDAQARPFVLLTGDHLRELQTEVRPGGGKCLQYLKQVKANAERWLSRSIVIPDRAGHFHHFTCTDGTRLSVPLDQQFDKTTTGAMQFKCPACGGVYSGDKYEGGMRHAEHTWLITACRDLALAGALEGRADYQQKAAEVLRKYAEAYPGRHTTSTQGGIYYQSLDESVHFITLAQAYDLIYDSGALTEEDKARIENDLFWESAEGFIKCGIGGNWGSWHLSAVGVIGYATKHQRYIDYGLRNFRSQMTHQLGDDGLWPESVHTYHFYPMRAFLYLAEAAANAGEDLYNWEAKPGKGLRAMFMQPLHYMYPNFQLPAINDGWFHSYLPLDIYQLGSKRYNAPKLAWAVEELKHRGAVAKTKSPDAVELWSLLHGKEGDKAVERPVFGPINFPVLGIAVLRHPETATTSESMMTFDYGRHLGHGQADKMGITLFANEQLLMADYGTPSYGASVLPYFKGTSSHNTIRIDGKDQPATTDSRLLIFDNIPGLQVASAITDQGAPGVQWQRTVALTPRYALTVDDFESSATHTYESFIHCEGDEFIAQTASDLEQTSAPSNFPYCSNVRQLATVAGQLTGKWMGGLAGTGVSVQSAGPEGTAYFLQDCPAETATRRVRTLITSVSGSSLRLATLVNFGDVSSAHELQMGANQVAVRSEDGAAAQFKISPTTITGKMGETSFSFSAVNGH